METLWKVVGFVLGLISAQLCNGLPINLTTTGPDPHTQYLTGLVAVLLAICSIILLAGCACCRRNKNGFTEFRDSPVVASVASNLDHGHVNPIANSEFTIFTPISPTHHDNNVFLANQRIVNRTEDDVKYGDIDVSSWFDGSEKDFPRTRLKYIRELGKGWFGRVVEGTAQGLNQDPGEPEWTPVVVRILEASASSKERVLFLHDADVYRHGYHPNVLMLLGRCLDMSPLLLLQEYCAEGDLKKYLRFTKPTKEKFLSSDLPLLWCYQLTQALKFLHEQKVPHPDLAARNCQLTKDLTLKLGDYGLNSSFYPEDYYQGSLAVPLRWCAPEIISYTNTTIQTKKVTLEGNIWSLGVTMWEILECGDQPYSELTDDEVISQVLGTPNIRLPRPTFNVIYTDYMYKLMQSCWSTSESRPSATHIDLILNDLMQVYEHTKVSTEQKEPTSIQDFDRRWETLKPNIVITDETPLIQEKKSESLTNLHGSLDNLLEGQNPMDSWLENVANNTGDLIYTKGLSEAMLDLDNALELSSDSNQPSPKPLHFKIGPKVVTSSESETEDENWKKKIERGAYTEKVRQKSRSVADLMILTHVDYSESDSETLPSLTDYKNQKPKYFNKTMENPALKFGSEGNLLSVHDTFQEELRKLQDERRDSLLFVPDKYSYTDSKSAESSSSRQLDSLENSPVKKLIVELNSPSEIIPAKQVYNVFNVSVTHLNNLGNIDNKDDRVTLHKKTSCDSLKESKDTMNVIHIKNKILSPEKRDTTCDKTKEEPKQKDEMIAYHIKIPSGLNKPKSIENLNDFHVKIEVLSDQSSPLDEEITSQEHLDRPGSSDDYIKETRKLHVPKLSEIIQRNVTLKSCGDDKLLLTKLTDKDLIDKDSGLNTPENSASLEKLYDDMEEILDEPSVLKKCSKCAISFEDNEVYTGSFDSDKSNDLKIDLNKDLCLLKEEIKVSSSEGSGCEEDSGTGASSKETQSIDDNLSAKSLEDALDTINNDYCLRRSKIICESFLANEKSNYSPTDEYREICFVSNVKNNEINEERFLNNLGEISDKDIVHQIMSTHLIPDLLTGLPDVNKSYTTKNIKDEKIETLSEYLLKPLIHIDNQSLDSKTNVVDTEPNSNNLNLTKTPLILPIINPTSNNKESEDSISSSKSDSIESVAEFLSPEISQASDFKTVSDGSTDCSQNHPLEAIAVDSSVPNTILDVSSEEMKTLEDVDSSKTVSGDSDSDVNNIEDYAECQTEPKQDSDCSQSNFNIDHKPLESRRRNSWDILRKTKEFLCQELVFYDKEDVQTKNKDTSDILLGDICKKLGECVQNTNDLNDVNSSSLNGIIHIKEHFINLESSPSENQKVMSSGVQEKVDQNSLDQLGTHTESETELDEANLIEKPYTFVPNQSTSAIFEEENRIECHIVNKTQNDIDAKETNLSDILIEEGPSEKTDEIIPEPINNDVPIKRKLSFPEGTEHLIKDTDTMDKQNLTPQKTDKGIKPQGHRTIPKIQSNETKTADSFLDLIEGLDDVNLQFDSSYRSSSNTDKSGDHSMLQQQQGVETKDTDLIIDLIKSFSVDFKVEPSAITTNRETRETENFLDLLSNKDKLLSTQSSLTSKSDGPEPSSEEKNYDLQENKLTKPGAEKSHLSYLLGNIDNEDENTMLTYRPNIQSQAVTPNFTTKTLFTEEELSSKENNPNSAEIITLNDDIETKTYVSIDINPINESTLKPQVIIENANFDSNQGNQLGKFENYDIYSTEYVKNHDSSSNTNNDSITSTGLVELMTKETNDLNITQEIVESENNENDKKEVTNKNETSEIVNENIIKASKSKSKENINEEKDKINSEDNYRNLNIEKSDYFKIKDTNLGSKSDNSENTISEKVGHQYSDDLLLVTDNFKSTSNKISNDKQIKSVELEDILIELPNDENNVIKELNLSQTSIISNVTAEDSKEFITKKENHAQIILNQTKDFLNNEIETYTDKPKELQVQFDLSDSQEEIAPNSLTHFQEFTSTPFAKKRSLESTVILGADDDYSIDFYSGLKTTVDPIEAEELKFSSNFLQEPPPREPHNDLYSLETWDNFLGKSFDEQENDLDFIRFNQEPHSLLFIENENVEFDNAKVDKTNHLQVSQVVNETYVPEPKNGDETFSVEVAKQEANITFTKNDETFVKSDATFVKNDSLNKTIIIQDGKPSTSTGWESCGGWFLHPQSNSEELSGQIAVQEATADSYVGFSMDDEIMAAIRNELLNKLPHAQRASSEQVEEREELEPAEKNEVFIRYNVYNTPLSPIPEESYVDSDDESPAYSPKRMNEDSDDDSSDWSIEDNISSNMHTEINSPKPESSILSSPAKIPNHRHTPSQDSCCSNDTLFNIEDLNLAIEHDRIFETIPDEDESSKESKYSDCKAEVEEVEDKTLIDDNVGEEEEVEKQGNIPKINVHSYITDFLNNERYNQLNSCIELTDLRSEYEECSSASDKYLTVSDNTLSFGQSVAPLNSPEDRQWKDLQASFRNCEETEQEQLLKTNKTYLTPLENTEYDVDLQKLSRNFELVTDLDDPELDNLEECRISDEDIDKVLREEEDELIINNKEEPSSNDNKLKDNISINLDNESISSAQKEDNRFYVNTSLHLEENSKITQNTNLDVASSDITEYDGIPNKTEESPEYVYIEKHEDNHEYENGWIADTIYANMPADRAKELDYVIVEENKKTEENIEDLYGPLADIRFSGPGLANLQMMSTSFSESNEVGDEQDWDSGSDTRSSSSGEFIWREGEHEASLKALDAAPQSENTQETAPMENIQEENESSSSDSDGEGECPEFVPSAWDKYAIPAKSALRSPEKTLERKDGKDKKGVWFKKQKYHCIYEYPKEPDSPILQSYDLWKPTPDYATLADWELGPDMYVPRFDLIDPLTSVTHQERSPKNLYHLTAFPEKGSTVLDEDFFVSSSSKPFDMLGGFGGIPCSEGSQFFPGRQFSDHWIDATTPDSGDEVLPFRENNTIPTLKHLATIAANKTRKSRELGGLRHTRSKLKLDLPPSPSAFSSNTTFTVEPVEEVVPRQVPTFSTFGKSRFLVQHVDTPPDDQSANKNVSFEALPYKPQAEVVKERHTIESVRGEASLLDSADEDSGIDSSTLERGKKVDT